MMADGMDPFFVILPLLPFALAAGIDLYLTVLVLGGLGRVWAGAPVPGVLGDLGALPVLVLACALYFLELAVERHAPLSLVWNSVHTVIRPVGAALLGLLLLPGAPWPLQVGAVVIGGALGFLAHGTRFGIRQLLRLSATPPPSFLRVSLTEDAGVILLLLVGILLPVPGALLALGAALAALTAGQAALRAGAFGVRLAWGAWASLLSERRWLYPNTLPAWVRTAGAGDTLAPGGILRGTRCAAYQLEGLGPFRIGWLVLTGSGPFFLCRRLGGVRRVPVAEARVAAVMERSLFHRVELQGKRGGHFALLIPLDGAAPDLLRGEFRAEPPSRAALPSPD